MQHIQTHPLQIPVRRRRAWPIGALAGICLTMLSQGLSAQELAPHAPPAVPTAIQAPAGNRPFLVGYATGTQNYICLPQGAGFAWTLFGPQATLFNDEAVQNMTHFLSPNPDEGGALRPTWQHSRDTSAVWGVRMEGSSDPAFVEPGAIEWLLLRVVGQERGPTGGGRLAEATYLQRIHTAGGMAPATGCSLATDVGKRAFVPYSADYVFYKATGQ